MKINPSKERILEVARNVFSRFGFSKTTMSDIAQAAKRGRRTIYSYFKSKEDIYQAVIQKEVDILYEKLSVVVKEKLSPREKLEKYLKTRMNTINELVNYYDAIKNAYHHHYFSIEPIRKKFDNDEVSMISSILNEGKKNNTINPTYAQGTSACCSSDTNGAAMISPMTAATTQITIWVNAAANRPTALPPIS